MSCARKLLPPAVLPSTTAAHGPGRSLEVGLRALESLGGDLQSLMFLGAHGALQAAAGCQSTWRHSGALMGVQGLGSKAKPGGSLEEVQSLQESSLGGGSISVPWSSDFEARPSKPSVWCMMINGCASPMRNKGETVSPGRQLCLLQTQQWLPSTSSLPLGPADGRSEARRGPFRAEAMPSLSPSSLQSLLSTRTPWVSAAQPPPEST